MGIPKRVGKYVLGDTIGEGTFGKVKYAENTETGEKVAIKVLNKREIEKHRMEEQIKKEVRVTPNLRHSHPNVWRLQITIMKMIKHKHVVNMKDFLNGKKYLYIVLELVTGGELFYKLGIYIAPLFRDTIVI